MPTRSILQEEVDLIVNQADGDPRKAAAKIRERARLDEALATGQRLSRPAAAERASARAAALRAHARRLEHRPSVADATAQMGGHRPAA